jgi:hypothetical protein
LLPFFGTVAVAGTVKLKSHTVPDSATLVVAVPLGSARLPVTAPGVAPVGGANVIAIMHVAPFATAVFEQASLPIAKLFAETVACPGVTDAPVLFVKVTVWGSLVPPISVPVNVKLVGFAVKPPAVVDPVPVNATDNGRAAPSNPSTIFSVADSPVATEGVKITPTVHEAPVAIDAPHVGPPGPAPPPTAKSPGFVPVIVGVARVTVDPVLLVTVAYCADELVPIITVPKSRLAGEIPIVGIKGTSATNAFVTAPAGNTVCAAPVVTGKGCAPVAADAV